MDVTAIIKKTKEFIRAVDSEGQETSDHEITLVVGLSRGEYLELARACIYGHELLISIVRAQAEMPMDGNDWTLPS